MPLIFHNNFYEGFIKAKGRRYFVRAYISDPLKWEPENLILDRRLYNELNESLDNFIESNCKCDFTVFFKELERFVTKEIGQTVDSNIWTTNPIKACNFYKSLQDELNEVQDYVRNIDVQEGTIEIEFVDPMLRIHNAVLQLTPNYPREPIKIITHNLPIQDVNPLQKNLDFECITTISSFCKRFVQCIICFQEFWNSISILDTNCWVLDPENPGLKDVMRRIKLSDRLSVVLVFNPYVAQQRPEIKFLGCHSDIYNLRKVLQKNLQNEVWSPEENILTNLKNLLEVEFPQRVEVNEEDSMNLVKQGECAICFLVRLDNEIPSEICDNEHCMSYYHVNCLFRYLSSIPTNKVFFGRIQGRCPNCEEVMSCPVPEFN